jgi:hypothetical protein
MPKRYVKPFLISFVVICTFIVAVNAFAPSEEQIREGYLTKRVGRLHACRTHREDVTTKECETLFMIEEIERSLR